MRSSQFTLARLLTSVTVIAAALALWRWLEGLGAVIGVLGLMVVVMMNQRRHRVLFTSSDGFVWLGGAMVTLSGFFRYVYGPYGAEVTQYGYIVNIDWSWNGFGWMTWLWPMSFGAITAIQGFLGLSVGGGLKVSQVRWAISAVFLAGVAVAHLAVFFKFGPPFGQMGNFPSYYIRYVGFPSAFLMAIAASVVFWPSPLRKYAVLQAFAALCILPGLYPVSSSIPIGDIFYVYGPGYYMHLGGILLILGASVRIWITAQPARP